MFSIEVGNVIISSCIIGFANARKMLWGLTFKYFERVKSSIPSSLTE